MTHLHGGFVAADSDGNPAVTPNGFGPGETQVVFYTNQLPEMPASLLWFHDHGLGATRLNVFAGLAAAYKLAQRGFTNVTVLERGDERVASQLAVFYTVLDDLIARGLRRPEFLIVDGAAGLDKAIAAVWNGVPLQRCTVHKHRNLLAHAPERLHEEITADYTDMIYAATPEDIATRRKAFVRKWRLKHRAVADSLEEAGDRLFAFARLPPSQWKSARTTNAIERLHEEFKRRIKTQTIAESLFSLDFCKMGG